MAFGEIEDVYRDQILILALLRQTMMTRKNKGMSAAFVDFKKAYERVN